MVAYTYSVYGAAFSRDSLRTQLVDPSLSPSPTFPKPHPHPPCQQPSGCSPRLLMLLFVRLFIFFCYLGFSMKWNMWDVEPPPRSDGRSLVHVTPSSHPASTAVSLLDQLPKRRGMISVGNLYPPFVVSRTTLPEPSSTILK